MVGFLFGQWYVVSFSFDQQQWPGWWFYGGWQWLVSNIVSHQCFAFLLVGGWFLFLRMVGGWCLNQYMVGGQWLMIGGLWMVGCHWLCTMPLILSVMSWQFCQLYEMFLFNFLCKGKFRKSPW